jgi:hypothetical protein
MSANQNHKRQMELMQRLARLAGYRIDTEIDLEQIDKSLDYQAFGGAGKFFDKGDPKPRGGSELTYDLNCLRDERGFIVVCYQKREQTTSGSFMESDPAIRLTQFGLDALVDWERGWLRTAIEKQPMTFIQIAVAVGGAVLGFLAGWIPWLFAPK